MATSTYISLVVIYSVQAIIIIAGNTFTIFVFWTQRSRLKRTYFLLINLAVADLLVGITELIVIGTLKSHDLGKGILLLNRSNFSAAFTLFFSSTSVYFLALVSMERAFAVLRPIRHRITNRRVYIYSIVIVWAIALVFFVLFMLSLYYPEINGVYVFVTGRTSLLISILIICTSYLSIRARLRAPSPAEIDNHKHRSREHNLRLSKTLYIAIASSLVFWMPAYIVFSTKGFCPGCFSAPVVIWLVEALYLANSMVNPLVYSFRMKIFKDAFNKFQRKRRQNIRSIQQNNLGFGLEGSFTPTLSITMI